jgi:hypothetical protein
MTLKSFDSYGQTFNIDDVVMSDYSSYAEKILRRVYIEAIEEYRFIMQAGAVRNNEFRPDKNNLSLASTKDLRNGHTHLWTKDVVVVKKGDVFTDANGRIYIVESDSLKAWNIDAGTWATLKVDGDVVKWDGRTLTEKKIVTGDKFSKYLG